MCLAVPGKIESIDAADATFRTGRVNFGGIVKTVNLAYVPDAKIEAMRTSWMAMDPSPPAPPQISTGSPGRTVWPGQPNSWRYAVGPVSMKQAASSEDSRAGLR